MAAQAGETAENAKKKRRSKTEVLRGDSRERVSVRADLVTPQGLEPQLTEPESVVLPITPQGTETDSTLTTETVSTNSSAG